MPVADEDGSNEPCMDIEDTTHVVPNLISVAPPYQSPTNATRVSDSKESGDDTVVETVIAIPVSDTGTETSWDPKNPPYYVTAGQVIIYSGSPPAFETSAVDGPPTRV